jgi:hypothetical protein
MGMRKRILQMIIEQKFSDFYSELLLEARYDRYLPILTGTNGPYSEYDKRHVSQVVKSLRRDDIIQWYLRWWRYLAWENERHNYHTTYRGAYDKSKSKWLDDFSNIIKNEKYAAPKELTNGSIRYSLELGTLEHFLSLPISEIKNFRFSYEDPRKIIYLFQKYEDKWKESHGEDNQWIDMTDEIDSMTQLIKFPDGFIWFDLSIPFCRKEGDAMGHCGNTASHKPSDTVLSLRKITKRGDKIFGRPSCTFILDKSTGMLGEMKGRANEKPAEIYHKYIISLLKLKDGSSFFIKGIRGGGYAPEQNFSVDDLDESERRKLYVARPELKPLKLIYKEEGLTERVKNLILDRLPPNTRNLVQFTNNGSIRIVSWKNIEELWQDIPSTQEPQKLKYYKQYVIDGDYMENHYHGNIHDDKNSTERLFDMVSRDSRYKSKGVDSYVSNKTSTNDDEDINEFDYLYDNEDLIIEQLNSAVRVGYEVGILSEMTENFLEGITDLKFIQDDTGYMFHVGYEDPTRKFNSPVYQKWDLVEFIEVIDTGSIDIDPHFNIFHRYNFSIDGDMHVPNYGFDRYDEKEAINSFFENLDI